MANAHNYVQHEGQIKNEEHLHQTGEQPRKAVGLFAKDFAGSGTFELSALSTASGVALQTHVLDPAAGSAANSTVFVGTPTLFAVVNTGGSAANVTLNPGPNQIGSVTVSNTVPVTGTFWQATQPVSFGLVSLASGTEIRALATLMNQPALVAGTAQIGSVTVSNMPALISLSSGQEIRSLVTLLNQPALVASSAFIGIVTIANPTNTSGQVTIFPGPNQIGSVTVSNFTAPNTGNVTVNPGPNYIGLVTTYNGRSAVTYFTQVVSASGYSTIFTPPSGQKWFLQAAMVNSMGVANGFLGSASIPVWTFPGLATYGGFAMPFNEPGLMAETVDRALTYRQYSLVTVAVSVHVRFE